MMALEPEPEPAKTPRLTIFHAILGDAAAADHMFSVTGLNSMLVAEWRGLVYAERRSRFTGYDAADLILWKLREPIASEEADDKLAALAKDQNLSRAADKMVPSKKLSYYFPEAPPRKSLHVIVQLPSLPSAGEKHGRLFEEDADDEPASKRKERVLRGESSDASTPRLQNQEIDITDQLVAKWSQAISALNLPDLHNYLQQPLAEDEKIPVSQGLFDRLSRNRPFVEYQHALSAQQVASLFRVSIDEGAWSTERLFVNAIEQVPPQNGTEDVFHSTWDENISRILRLILPEASHIRNSNRNTSTAQKLPDYGFILKNRCLVRGEEKGSDSDGDPRKELVDKLQWTYDPLPYILGYYAITTEVHFVAITAPPFKTIPLFDHNLKFKKDRVANLVHLVRLSSVVAQLGEKSLNPGRPEFMTFERDGGLVRMSIAAVVTKEFRHPDAVARVSDLIEIYRLLKAKRVPNVDELVHYSTRENYSLVELSPVGQDTLPESGSDSLNSVVCVLQALRVMHSDPDPVYHRDIREPNIIKRSNGQGWFLIDWSDASTAPTRAVTHLKRSEHSPRVCEENHGAEVDIWGVGRYMENLASRVTCRIANPDAVQQMARRWIADPTTSAVSALEEINSHQDLFTVPTAQIS